MGNNMKVVKEVAEVSGEGLESLLGEKITLICSSYFYTGILKGVNCTCIKLTDAKIIYETGSWSEKNYKTQEALPSEIYVQIAAIESFGRLKG